MPPGLSQEVTQDDFCHVPIPLVAGILRSIAHECSTTGLLAFHPGHSYRLYRWTVTHEEIFAVPRNFCRKQSLSGKTLFHRKFFYLFTCEYCFSFYVTASMLIITKYQLLYLDWRGYLVSGFSLIWVANIYMSLFFRIRTDLKNEGLAGKIKESELKKLN